MEALTVVRPTLLFNYKYHIFIILIASFEGSLHVVVDNFLVTGQNEQSTLTAVQNLILLSNARSEMTGIL